MHNEPETKEYFVPAMALEHNGNQEDYKLSDKIKAAIYRLHLNGNFTELISVHEPMPYVYLEKYAFDRDRMGYTALAKVSS